MDINFITNHNVPSSMCRISDLAAKIHNAIGTILSFVQLIGMTVSFQNFVGRDLQTWGLPCELASKLAPDPTNTGQYVAPSCKCFYSVNLHSSGSKKLDFPYLLCLRNLRLPMNLQLQKKSRHVKDLSRNEAAFHQSRCGGFGLEWKKKNKEISQYSQ